MSPLSVFGACFNTNKIYRLDLAIRPGVSRGAVANQKWSYHVPDGTGLLVCENADIVVGCGYKDLHVVLLHIDTGVLIRKLCTSYKPSGIIPIPANAERVFYKDNEEKEKEEAAQPKKKEQEIRFAYLTHEGGFVPCTWIVKDAPPPPPSSVTNFGDSGQQQKKKKNKQYSSDSEDDKDGGDDPLFDNLSTELTFLARAPNHGGCGSGCNYACMLPPDAVTVDFYTNALTQRAKAFSSEDSNNCCATDTMSLVSVILRSSEGRYYRYSCDMLRQTMVLEDQSENLHFSMLAA